MFLSGLKFYPKKGKGYMEYGKYPQNVLRYLTSVTFDEKKEGKLDTGDIPFSGRFF
jgi:hypothetical protein